MSICEVCLSIHVYVQYTHTHKATYLEAHILNATHTCSAVKVCLSTVTSLLPLMTTFLCISSMYIYMYNMYIYTYTYLETHIFNASNTCSAVKVCLSTVTSLLPLARVVHKELGNFAQGPVI